MLHSKEFTDFEHGTVVGGHHCNKSVYEIPRSTVKHSGTTATQPWSGRSCEVTGQRCSGIQCVKVASTLLTQSINISTPPRALKSARKLRQECHVTGFHSRAAPVGVKCRCPTFAHILYVLAGFCSFLTCKHNNVTCSFYLPHKLLHSSSWKKRSCVDSFVFQFFKALQLLLFKRAVNCFHFQYGRDVSLCAI